MEPRTEPSWQRAPGVLWRQFGGGVLLLGPSGAEPTLVSGIGPLLWDLLATPRTLAELVTEVCSAAGASAPDEATVRGDIDRVLADLTALGLTERLRHPQ